MAFAIVVRDLTEWQRLHEEAPGRASGAFAAFSTRPSSGSCSCKPTHRRRRQSTVARSPRTPALRRGGPTSMGLSLARLASPRHSGTRYARRSWRPRARSSAMSSKCQAGDGRRRTFDFSLKPVSGEAGQVALLIAEGRDITDRKRLGDPVAPEAENGGHRSARRWHCA